MKKEYQLLTTLLYLLSFIQTRPCDDYCPTTFTDAAYCLSNRRIYPSICSAGCSKSEMKILFVCKLNNNQDLRYCSARCSRSSIEETDKLFNGKDCKCPRVYNPVCAENKETFFNDCFRICKKFKRKVFECEFCEEEGDKVGCRQRCEDNALGYCDGPEFEVKDMTYLPVCGADGKMYVNEEIMGLGDVEAGEVGSCDEKSEEVKKVETS